MAVRTAVSFAWPDRWCLLVGGGGGSLEYLTGPVDEG